MSTLQSKYQTQVQCRQKIFKWRKVLHVQCKMKNSAIIKNLWSLNDSHEDFSETSKINCASTFLTKKYCPVKLDTTWTKVDKTPASIFFVFYHQRLFLDKQEPYISNQDWRSGKSTNFRINIFDHGLKVTAFPP